MRRTSTFMFAGFLIAGFLLFTGACSDSGTGDTADDDSGNDSTSSSVAVESTEPDDSQSDDSDAAEPTMLKPSPVSATIDQLYPGTDIITAGQVTADWYQEGGNYVVVYSGLDLASIGPACPGNSIELASGGFSSVSNAPTGEGGCEGATTPEPPQAPQICGDLIVYSTAISTSEEGTLYGSFEQPSGSGGFVGGTSTVTADAAAAPEIQTGAAAYSLGGTDYTC